MASSDPEMPSAQKPVRIALEPDAKVVIRFSGAHADKAPCSGTVVYRLMAEAESQTWEVSLNGYRVIIHRQPMYLLNPGNREMDRVLLPSWGDVYLCAVGRVCHNQEERCLVLHLRFHKKSQCSL